jgi:DHA1 family multidrug resistance protein-like MFS transporter
MNSDTRPSLLPPQLRLFLVAMFFVEASRTMTMVQIPVFLRELGADVSEVGLFFTIALIFPLLLRVFGGWLSDSIGRLRAMLLGGVAGVLTHTAYALAPTWQAALLGPSLLAVATALTIPSYYAYIGDTVEEDRRGRMFGLAEAARTTAWILAPPLGGVLAQSLGPRWMFLGAALAAAAATLVFLVMFGRRDRAVSEPRTERPSWASLRGSLVELTALALSGGLITWILITDGVRDVALKVSFDLMPVYLTDIAGLTRQDIGLLDGIFGLAWALTSYPAGWLTDKASERVVLVIGIVLQITSRLVFALAGGFWGFALSWILLAMGGAALDPAYSSLIARGVPQRVRGLTYGLVATSLGLISLPFPWIGGQLWERIDPKAPFLISVVFGALAILPAWRKLTRPDQRAGDAAAVITQ